MPENLKLLKRASTLFEAHAIRGHLDSHGITCSIPDEMTGSTQPHLLLALGDFRIMVHGHDFDEAASILRELDAENDKHTQNDTPVRKSRMAVLASIAIYIVTGMPCPIRNKTDKKPL
ncbi:MAG: hypothetical protein COB36_01145 [Alphaproteobacteria bacterium]|nr:MAG: hypothetical protein COB36_01145 [Alphaproteobacteria bacterium]